MSVKIISFDLDGTLTMSTFANEVWHEYLPSLVMEKLDMTREEAKEYCRRQYEKVGDERPEWYDLEYWVKKFGLEVRRESIFEACAHAAKLYPEVRDVLSKLTGYRLIVCTNAPKDFAEFQLRILGIINFFERVYSALSDFGEVKKNRTYRLILEELNILPQEMLHVGDHPKFDLEIPRSIGINAYLIDRASKKEGPFVIRDLRELLNLL